MKSTQTIRLVLPLMLIFHACSSGQAQAQEETLPQFTDEQRWDRMSFHWDSWAVASILQARADGRTAEDAAQFIGELFAPGWGENFTPRSFMRGTYRNLMAWRDARFEVLEVSDQRASFRFSRSYASSFGEDGERLGVTVEEMDLYLVRIHQVIVEHNGLTFHSERDGDDIIFTVTVPSGA